jgi:hypothetical protein
MKEVKEVGMVTLEETAVLISALLTARGKRGATEAEMQQVYDWAVDTRIDYAMLNLVLGGKAYVDINAEGELVYGLVYGRLESQT